MDQAPNMINNGGKLFLAYTSVTTLQSLYFYDLENGRTCAKVPNAELFIECYPNKTDPGLTFIRYIKDKDMFLRSVDF